MYGLCIRCHFWSTWSLSASGTLTSIGSMLKTTKRKFWTVDTFPILAQNEFFEGRYYGRSFSESSGTWISVKSSILFIFIFIFRKTLQMCMPKQLFDICWWKRIISR